METTSAREGPRAQPQTEATRDGQKSQTQGSLGIPTCPPTSVGKAEAKKASGAGDSAKTPEIQARDPDHLTSGRPGSRRDSPTSE